MAAHLLNLFRGRQPLRRGDFGPRVLRLQKRLAELGYDVGPQDGRFGYLTEDALLAFQRDHHLRVDGRAGAQVAFALRQRIPRQRFVHVVGEGERLSDIAALFDVSVAALRRMNALGPRAVLRPGRRLVIHSLYVLVGLDRQANLSVAGRELAKRRRWISGMSASRWLCGPDGALQEQAGDVSQGEAWADECGWGYFESVAGEGSSLAEIWMRRRSRRRFLEEFAARFGTPAAAGGKIAVLLDVGSVPAGAGARVESVLAEARRRAPGVFLAATAPPPQGGWQSFVRGLDAPALARTVDRLVLSLHDWNLLLNGRTDPPSKNELERWVARGLRGIAPWKVWLGIPLQGVFMESGRPWELAPYRRLVTEGFRRRVRPRRDETGFVHFEGAAEDGSRWRGFIPGRDAVSAYLSLAYRFHLGGVYFHPCGAEDPRVWELLPNSVKAYRQL